MILARLTPSAPLRTMALGLSFLAGLGLSGCLGGGDGSGRGDGGAGAGGAGGGGGAGGAGGEFGTGSTPPEQFYQQLAGVVCDTYYRCCPNGIGGTDPLGGRTNCVSTITGLASEGTGEALAAGNVVYNASAGNSCINVLRQRLSTAPCGGEPIPDLSNDPAFAVCIDAFVGQVAAGGSCVISNAEQGFTTSSDIVCAPGLACFTAEGDDFADQTCNAPAAAGGACTDTDGCVDGLYCPFGGGEPVCTAKAADGAECDDDDGCTSDNCDFEVTPSVCTEVPTSGEACGAAQKSARAPLADFKVLRIIPALRSLTGR